MNAHLPNDIVVTDLQVVADNFAILKNVVGKQYRYSLLNQWNTDPFLKDFVWHLRPTLDLKSTDQLLEPFLGTQDFKSLCASGTQVKDLSLIHI